MVAGGGGGAGAPGRVLVPLLKPEALARFVRLQMCVQAVLSFYHAKTRRDSRRLRRCVSQSWGIHRYLPTGMGAAAASPPARPAASWASTSAAPSARNQSSPLPPPKGHGNPPHTIRMIFHSKLAPHAFHMESINTGWASPSRTARWPSRSPWGESTGGPTAPSPTSHARSRGASWRWSRRTGWRGWCVCLVRLCGDGWEGKRKEGKVLGEIAAPIFLPHCGLVSTCGLDA